jgi:hypothetical protein
MREVRLPAPLKPPGPKSTISIEVSMIYQAIVQRYERLWVQRLILRLYSNELASQIAFLSILA